MFGIRNEPGWFGSFTRRQAEGAIPNGTRVRKINSEPGDANPDGTLGVVLGSFISPADPRVCYFVEWSGAPRIAAAVVGRIEPCK